MSGLSIPVGRINADVFTSPHASPDSDPEPAVVKALGSATASVHFAIYSLTSQAIADALLGAHARGVPMVGVVDAGELKVATSKVAALLAAGIDVRSWGSTWRLMHDKVLVVDAATRNAVVGIGSYNWTTQAEKSNIEVLLMARGTQVSRILAPTMTEQILAAHDGGKPLA